MTSDFPPPDPTSPAGRRRGLALLAVSGLLVTTAVACGSDTGGDDPTASDPTTSAAASSPTESPSASASASGSASASDSPTDSGDPVPSPIINKAAKAAIKDDFPALVPAGVPAGWTVVDAAYRPGNGGSWRIDLTDPNGAEVVLVQETGATVAELAAEHLGKDATAGGKANLSGTGSWAVYESATHTGIGKKITDTGALVYGPDQDTVVALGELLLTAEDAGSGTGDG